MDALAIPKSRTRSVVRVHAPLSNGKILAINLAPCPDNPSSWSVRIGHRRLVTSTEVIFDLHKLVDDFSLHGIDLSPNARGNWLRQLLWELKSVGLSAMLVKSAPGPTRMTRAQRRYAAQVDRAAMNDRRFFKRFPHRQCRVRLATQNEIDQAVFAIGQKAEPIPGHRYLALIRQDASGLRIKTTVQILKGTEFDDIDMSEEKAAALWDWATVNLDEAKFLI